MDTEFDLTELLLVTDMNELEEGEKCYIQWYHISIPMPNTIVSLFKITSIIDDTLVCCHANDETTRFELIYNKNERVIISNNKFDICSFIGIVCNVRHACNIYKLTTNE
jgi:hypothetical protein